MRQDTCLTLRQAKVESDHRHLFERIAVYKGA